MSILYGHSRILFVSIYPVMPQQLWSTRECCMVVTDKVIYLQLQKTGCSHIERLLKTHFPATTSSLKHRRLPDRTQTEGKIVIGSVRNPWDWYVSLWSFGCISQGGARERSTSPNTLTVAQRHLRHNRSNLVPLNLRLPKVLTHLRHELARPVSDYKRLYSDREDVAAFREWLRLLLDPGRRFDSFQDYGYSEVCSHVGLFSYL